MLACVKHFVAYGESQGGRDSSETDVSVRKMMTYFLPPFKETIVKGGAKTVMTAYQSVDGVPCTQNEWLLTSLLRSQWNFSGIVITDFDNIGRMVTEQFVCNDFEEATAKALLCGNDMAMGRRNFIAAAINVVKDGRVPMEVIDRSVTRILRMKMEQGLFDDQRFVKADDENGGGGDHDDGSGGQWGRIGSAEDALFAKEVAERSTVLLKNDHNILPLSPSVRLAVIGPNAIDKNAQMGEWTAGGRWAPRECHADVVCVLDGIKKRCANVVYCKGCDVLGDDDGVDDDEFKKAVQIARDAEVAVVVLGDVTELNGEMHDRASLDLTGKQERLLRAIHHTGTKVILVVVCGKPLTIPWAAENVPAIVTAFNSGMGGGDAIGGVLFGDVNPSGKLCVSWPRCVGQTPLFYNQIPGWHAPKYADCVATPQWRFGHGLSFTSFRYSNLRFEKEVVNGESGEGQVVVVDLENSGGVAGIEIVQVYVTDLVSSVTVPRQQLKAFRSVRLAPSERVTLQIPLSLSDLALVSRDLRYVVESGLFEVYVGGTSDLSQCLKGVFEVKVQGGRGVVECH